MFYQFITFSLNYIDIMTSKLTVNFSTNGELIEWQILFIPKNKKNALVHKYEEQNKKIKITD